VLPVQPGVCATRRIAAAIFMFRMQDRLEPTTFFITQSFFEAPSTLAGWKGTTRSEELRVYWIGLVPFDRLRAAKKSAGDDARSMSLFWRSFTRRGFGGSFAWRKRHYARVHNAEFFRGTRYARSGWVSSSLDYIGRLRVKRSPGDGVRGPDMRRRAVASVRRRGARDDPQHETRKTRLPSWSCQIR